MYNIYTLFIENPGFDMKKFDFLLPFNAFKVPLGYTVSLDDFRWTSFPTYVKLADNAVFKFHSAVFPVSGSKGVFIP